VLGAVSFEVYVPVKPTVTDACGEIVASKDSSAAVTVAPDWVYVASHMVLICWSPGNVQVRAQLLIAPVPVLSTVTWAWKPPVQELTSEYVAEQDSGPGGPVGDGDGDGLGDGDGDGEGDGDALGDGDGEAPGAPV
jgi:hypothetical protein